MNSAAKRWARVGLAQDVHGFLLLIQNGLWLPLCTSNLHNQQSQKVKITPQAIQIVNRIKIVSKDLAFL